jgi:hypothetical protein
MFKKKDPNSFTKYFRLFNGAPQSNNNGGYNNQIGYLVADYHVIPYEDVEVKDINSFASKGKRQFILHCTQRIVIYNDAFQTLNPIHFSDSVNGSGIFENYPVLIKTLITVAPKSQSGFTIQLLDYSPKTINTKVAQSGSSNIGITGNESSSISNTVGSSTSQTNSYATSVGVNGGFFGDLFTGGASVTHSSGHSTTNSSYNSQTNGSSSSFGTSNDQSNTDSMSIKDWGAYGIVNPETQEPAWFFGQEYPWDAITCTLTDGTINPTSKDNPNAGNQIRLILPIDMRNRLYDGKSLYPPSQLSMFGINFVSKAVWLLSADYSQIGVSSDIELMHTVNYKSASHNLTLGDNGNAVAAVYVDKVPTLLRSEENKDSLSESLNLMIMALDVLGLPNKPAIIGFIPKKFIVNPSAGAFKIISSANTLMIEDTTNYGDSYPASKFFSTSETALTATLTTAPPNPLSITAYFKVVDTVNDYKLYLKHWKMGTTGTTGIKLTITINGDSNNSIIKYVDTSEAEGGENNLLIIALRDQNYASVDYHDYLQLGLNSIQLTIEPIDGQYGANCGYQIRAISIEKM